MILYVYYKFTLTEFPDLKDTLQQLQAQVKEQLPSLSIKLLKRPEADSAGQHTWMEVYECEPEQLPMLQASLQALVAIKRLPIKRACEIFVDA